MKKRLIVCLVAVVLVTTGLFFYNKQTKDPYRGWQTYTDDRVGFEIKVPPKYTGGLDKNYDMGFVPLDGSDLPAVTILTDIDKKSDLNSYVITGKDRWQRPFVINGHRVIFESERDSRGLFLDKFVKTLQIKK